MENNETKQSFGEAVKGFAAKHEDKAQAVMNGGANLVGKIKSFSKKTWIIIGAIVAALVVGIVLVCTLTNMNTTPVSIAQSLANTKKYVSYEDRILKSANGFATSEIKACIKILKKAEDYKDDLKEAEEEFKEYLEDQNEELGKNWKVKYKVEEKEKMEHDDIKDIRDSVRNRADKCIEELEEVLDSDNLEKIADNYGLSKAEMKELVKASIKLAKKVKAAKFGTGYEISGKILTTGSNLDEPDEDEFEMVVVKVDGRWINVNILYTLLSVV